MSRRLPRSRNIGTRCGICRFSTAAITVGRRDVSREGYPVNRRKLRGRRWAERYGGAGRRGLPQIPGSCINLAKGDSSGPPHLSGLHARCVRELPCGVKCARRALKSAPTAFTSWGEKSSPSCRTTINVMRSAEYLPAIVKLEGVPLSAVPSYMTAFYHTDL